MQEGTFQPGKEKQVSVLRGATDGASHQAVPIIPDHERQWLRCNLPPPL